MAEEDRVRSTYVGRTPAILIDDAPTSLSLGLVIGTGPTTKPWIASIQSLSRRVYFASTGVRSPLGVNVVFYVHSWDIVPDWEGDRTAKFSRRAPALMIQCAVPAEAPEDVDTYVANRVAGAIDLAEEFGLKRKVIDRPLDELRAILAAAREQPE